MTLLIIQVLRSLWYLSANSIYFWRYRVKENSKNIAFIYLKKEKFER